MANRTTQTPKKIDDLCVEIEKRGGNLSASCEALGIPRQTVYDWRKASPEIDRRISEAVDRGADVLEDECRRRAFAGTDEPVFYQGVECGAVRKYSDTLAIFLLKGIRPEKYRERLGVDFSSATDEQIEKAILAMPDDKLRGLISRIRT